MAVTFKWIGKNLQGSVKQGEMSSETKEDVISSLRKQGIIPTSVTEKKKASTSSFFGPKQKKITDRDVIIFTRQFSTMFNAGIPIVQSLDILSKQIGNRSFGDVISKIKNDIETGSTLADSMRKYPKAFDPLYVNMVQAGEAGGVLDTVLIRLAEYMEKSMKLKKKVKGAMIYPSVILSVAVAVVAVIMVFVIPVFAKVFGEMGVPLPGPTLLIIKTSNFLASIGGLILLGCIIFGIMGFLRYRKTEIGKKTTDGIFLKLPIVGDLIRKVAIARFSRTLSTLISSGVPILDALEICARTSGNKVIEGNILNVKKEVTTGKTIAEPLAKAPAFPPMVVQMIGVGESTGSLDQMLFKIADFYDDEVDQSVANLTVALEPALMIFLGVVVGFIVVSLYLPIFKIGQVVR